MIFIRHHKNLWKYQSRSGSWRRADNTMV